ncbi:MAG: hypothetical protein HC831_04965 [Chloroflexia bacterium]|nr:hypothetical protein [Chloroflexia bacterium]
MRAILLFLLLLYSINMNAQWTKIAIKGIGTIEIPPTMEVKGGEWKEITDKLYKIKEYQIPNVVLQPTGMNDLNKSALNKFARIIITRLEFEEPSNLGLMFKKESIKNSELSDLNEIFQQNISNQIKNINILEWYPLEIVKINNMSALRMDTKELQQLIKVLLLHILTNYLITQ